MGSGSISKIAFEISDDLFYELKNRVAKEESS